MWVYPKRNYYWKVIQRKLQLFGHTCRVNNSGKIKSLVFSARLTSLDRAIAKGNLFVRLSVCHTTAAVIGKRREIGCIISIIYSRYYGLSIGIKISDLE